MSNTKKILVAIISIMAICFGVFTFLKIKLI